VLELAQACLRAAGVQRLTLDLADVRVIDAVLAPVPLSPEQTSRIHAALANKDAAELRALAKDLPATVRADLIALTRLYGDLAVLDEAERGLSASPLLQQALGDLRRLAGQLQGLSLGFDLADLRGYAYYTGVRFAFFADVPSLGGAAQSVELARGGRYDEVGAVFGRKRPAVGFSLDLKDLVGAVPSPALRPAIRAPWGSDNALRAAIAGLRAQGHTVVCVLPGHEHQVDEFQCDRELVADPQSSGGWSVKHL
jgi:ATP phosphoribosyltransferase regulatory subunit